ncbi:MAG: hypothetical protein KJ623_00965 [Nanoarchaeota archaeon]|nr:hypothetical protein [Nanoarchaeota archaeon]
MKFKILFLMTLLLLVSFANASNDISMDLVSYNPIILTPGTYFTAVFQVENVNSENLTDIDFELDTDTGLSVESNSKKNIDVLEPGKSIQLTYNLRVNTDATSGYKDLTLSYDNSDSDSQTFSVFINSIETNLILDSVQQQDFIPGNHGKLTINLDNKASYSLKNINIILDLTNAPFAPVDSSNSKNIALMNSYGSQDIEFNLITLPTADAGTYKIPITITYFDEFSRSYNISSLISLTISAYPFLDVSIDQNSLIQNTQSTVTVKFVNRGLTGIKFLNVKLLSSNNYNILSADNFYIGDVDIDDYQTIDFQLNPKTAGTITLPLMISYKDANNKDYLTTLNLNTKVYNINEAKQLGLIKSSSFGYIIFFLILIVGIILYLKYRKR